MMTRGPHEAESPTVTSPGSTADNAILDELTHVGTRPRLLFLLGESRSTDTEDVTQRIQAEAENVISGGSFSPAWERTLRPLGTWSYALHHRVRDLYLIGDAAAATGLRYVSAMSIGKASQCDSAMVKQAIERAEPELIVCAGCEAVYWPLLGRLELGHDLLTTVYGEPVYYSTLQWGERRSVLLHFWHPSQGYFTKGGHHYLFKLFMHAYDALCRKRLLTCS